VVRPDRPIEPIELGPLEPIRRAIDAWLPILVSPSEPTSPGPALALRELVWERIEPHLDGVVTVLVSPDGPICLVPLAALPGKELGCYLIEERAIAVAPVPRLVGFLSRRSPGPIPRVGPGPAEAAPALLLVGDIDYEGEPGREDPRGVSRSAATSLRAGRMCKFGPLPATREEIQEVWDCFQEKFPGAGALIMRGAEATEGALRLEAPRCRFLHLATHGYFAPAELRSALGPIERAPAQDEFEALGGAGVAGFHPGLLSGIALAGANRDPVPIGEDDGILTALEVAELDLSELELAVLSACETGLGEVAGGEGLIGLQRAFHVAGAHAVIASLWKIDDQATRALMGRFYKNLWGQGLAPMVALREAQLSILRGECDVVGGTVARDLKGTDADSAGRPNAERLPPYYWAAFVVSMDDF
jgi:CHAT domain-containing protein